MERPGTRTTRDRLSMMAQIERENDRLTREWVKQHEAAPRA